MKSEHLPGRIRNTHLPKSKALLPIFEAVINTFQAIERRVAKVITSGSQTERRGNLDDGKPGPIKL